MSVPGRARHTPARGGRGSRRPGGGTRLGAGRGASAWVKWSVPLVLVLVVVAVSLWGLARSAESTSSTGDPPLRAEDSSGAVGPAGAAAPRIFVSLTFDDGTTTQNLAGRVLRAHGMHGTFYMNTGKTEARDPYHLNWPQILRLHGEGNEIGGHTSTHINLTDAAIPEPVKRQEVCQDRERLQQRGLDPTSFAYPYGAFDDTAKAIVESCGYRSARSAGTVFPDGPVFAETVPPTDPFATRALNNPAKDAGAGEAAGVAEGLRGSPISLDYLQRAVVSVADHGGGWLQIAFHAICSNKDPRYATCMSGQAPIDLDTFDAFLEWLQNSAPDGTSVSTVREVMNMSAAR
jgi:peptidoglycan/xylan/chitin deacetylase (PgdA/CDA1 family)